MDTIVISLLLCFVTSICISVLSWKLRSHKSAGRLPPGLYPFPIIGNLHQLGKNPHQSLAKLSKTCGPLMSLKLGSITTIVASSATVAREVLKEHDQMFSSRAVPAAARSLDFHMGSMLWLPAVSSKWRNRRKIWKEFIFGAQKLDSSQGIRQEKLRELREFLHRSSIGKKAVNIGGAAFTTTFNTLSMTLFSEDSASYDSYSSQELKEVVSSVMENFGAPNLSDYFPVLQMFDLQGITRSTEYCIQRLFDIFDDIINIRLQVSGTSEAKKKNDILDALLDHIRNNVSEFSRDDLKHLLVDLFVGGSDTTTVTIEWAMAELLRHPDKLSKLKAELKVVNGQREVVQESDISRLPYLQAVIKETFRLHPPAPFAAPRKVSNDVVINGYVVPKNARVVVNSWALGRDPETWSNPQVFEPERFLNCDIDVRGRHFELIPFSSGRRICPGFPMAYPMVHTMLAAFVHDFDWKLEEGMKPEDLDMEEKFGLTVQKSTHLEAFPVKLHQQSKNF